jgi:hypothetical protein
MILVIFEIKIYDKIFEGYISYNPLKYSSLISRLINIVKF